MATTRTKKTTTKSTTKATTKATKSFSFDSLVFDYQVSPKLLAQALHIYTDNSHQHTSKVKNRGEVNRTNKKVYKQKGTGNARHGTRSAPIYVGGGVAHGPTGIRANRKSLNKKMKAAALAGIMAIYLREKHLEHVELPQIDKPSTSAVKSLFTAPRSLVVSLGEEANLAQSLSNLDNTEYVHASKLNAYLVSLHKHIYLTSAAHDHLVARLKPLLKSKSDKKSI